MKAIGKVFDFILPSPCHNPLADVTEEMVKEMETFNNSPHGGVIMPAKGKERMSQLIDDVNIDREKHKQTFWAGMVFMVIAMVGIWSNVTFLNILGLLSFIVMMWWWAKGNNLYNRIQNESGFIEGMMYLSYLISKDVHTATHSKEELTELKKRVEEDLGKLEQGLEV